MASEEIVTSETLSGRIFKPPRTLALTSDGSLRLPPGSVIDFALANQVVLPDNLRTEIRDEIISQVSTDYLNGNLVHQNTNSSATDAVSTVLLGNNNADITGTTGLNNATYDAIFSSANSYMTGAVANSQISSSSGSYIDNASAPSITYLDIDSSQNSYFQNTGIGTSPTMCSISGCTGCFMDDTQGTTSVSCLHGSNGSSIRGGSGNTIIACSSSSSQRCNRSSILACDTVNVVDLIASAIIGSSTVVSNTVSVGNGRARLLVAGGNRNNLSGSRIEESVILGSTDCNLYSHQTPTAGTNRLVNCAILGSWASNIRFETNPNSGAGLVSLVSADRCNITGNTTPVGTSLISSSSLCTISGGTRTGILDSISSTATDCSSCSLVSSSSSSITSSAQSSIFNGSSSTITGSTGCAVIGSGSTITGRTNCLSWNGGALTGDNQASFGGSTRFAGNMVQTSGYVQPYSGITATVRSSAANTTLSLGDRTIILTGTAILTLPLASTFGANYPLDTEVKFKIIRTGAANNDNSILTTSPDLLNNIAGFTIYGDAVKNRTVELLLVNTTVSPHWRFAQALRVNVFYGSMVTDNTFGTTPVPKSDAAQLPTSTSQATHEALGATSYVYFDGPSYGASSINVSSGISPPAAVPGVQLWPGIWKITYRYTVRTTSGGGNYRLRSDVRNNATGLTITGSYAETDGLNAIGGTRTTTVVCPEVVIATSTIFTLRLSQDATSTISATAAISDVCMDISGYL